MQFLVERQVAGQLVAAILDLGQQLGLLVASLRIDPDHPDLVGDRIAVRGAGDEFPHRRILRKQAIPVERFLTVFVLEAGNGLRPPDFGQGSRCRDGLVADRARVRSRARIVRVEDLERAAQNLHRPDQQSRRFADASNLGETGRAARQQSLKIVKLRADLTQVQPRRDRIFQRRPAV